MKKRTVLLFIILVLVLCTLLFPSQIKSIANRLFASSKPPDPPNSLMTTQIIYEFVQAYAESPAEASTQISHFISQLNQEDKGAAVKWQEIMDYWQYADSTMEVNTLGVPDNITNSDQLCFIVLGFQLNSDGTMKDELIRRLETALICAETFPDSFILCTGGGTAYRNKDITEADAMANWLEHHGVAPNRIIIENRSLTTTQNAVFSGEILRSAYPQITSAVIISSDYHIPWGAVLFQTQFILADQPIRIISNAACTANARLSPTALLHAQANGILSIYNYYQ